MINSKYLKWVITSVLTLLQLGLSMLSDAIANEVEHWIVYIFEGVGFFSIWLLILLAFPDRDEKNKG